MFIFPPYSHGCFFYFYALFTNDRLCSKDEKCRVRKVYQREKINRKCASQKKGQQHIFLFFLLDKSILHVGYQLIFLNYYCMHTYEIMQFWYLLTYLDGKSATFYKIFLLPLCDEIRPFQICTYQVEKQISKCKYTHAYT